MSHKKTFLINLLDLLVVCYLAIAQPIFDLLAKNVEFLAARDSNAATIILLTITTTLLPPAVLCLIEYIAGMIGKKTFNYTHRILLWILLSLLFISPLKPLYQFFGIGWIILGLVPAGIISETYLRFRQKGLALAYLSPIVVIFSGYFLMLSPVHKILHSTSDPIAEYPNVHATAPIVMIVFDEFPLISLMDDQGQINSHRYPNFAELAQSATWYRNASTIADNTMHALPAMLNGLIPVPEKLLLPSSKDHPHSLFTLLGGSYRMKVVENNTRLCPKDLCTPVGYSRYESIRSLFSDLGVLYLYLLLPSELTYSLPDITLSWKQFAAAEAKIRAPAQRDEAFNRMADWNDRLQVFVRFIENIHPDKQPTLHFLHTLLPHAPWEYLPSGKMYTLRKNTIRGLQGINDRGLDPDEWISDPWAIQQAYQKHLLQVAMVDRLVGKLINHMKRVKLFEPSLLVITADHGTSFQARASRRIPGPTNYCDIISVPLFIKAPYQKRGRIDDSNMESIDIFPTMAEILEIPLPWHTDGRSALNPSIRKKNKKTVVLASGKRLEFDAQLPGRYESIKDKIAQFGYGFDDLFHIGPFNELLGLNIESQHVTISPVKCRLDGNIYLEDVDLDSPFIPANICGQLSRDQQPSFSPLNLAVALNGVIRSVTRSYLNREGQEQFSSILSENHFQPGHNHVAIYVITKVDNQFELAEAENTEVRPYQWGEVLQFGVNGNAKPYKERGWSPPEQGFNWTIGNRVDLTLPTLVPHKSIHLKLHAKAYLNPGIVDRQRVKLFINQ